MRNEGRHKDSILEGLSVLVTIDVPSGLLQGFFSEASAPQGSPKLCVRVPRRTLNASDNILSIKELLKLLERILSDAFILFGKVKVAIMSICYPMSAIVACLLSARAAGEPLLFQLQGLRPWTYRLSAGPNHQNQARVKLLTGAQNSTLRSVHTPGLAFPSMAFRRSSPIPSL